MNAMIESALANIAASVPSLALSMRHGTDSGSVISSSSIDRSGESLSGDEPREVRRVIGKCRDFPSLSNGAIVALDGVPHIVTSAKVDNTRTMLKVGLSAGIDQHIEISAVRRGGLDCGGGFIALVEERGFDDLLSEESSATTRRLVFIVIPCEGEGGWCERTQDGAPRTGDRVTLPDLSEYTVVSVRKGKSAFYLTAREKSPAR